MTTEAAGVLTGVLTAVIAGVITAVIAGVITAQSPVSLGRREGESREPSVC